MRFNETLKLNAGRAGQEPAEAFGDDLSKMDESYLPDGRKQLYVRFLRDYKQLSGAAFPWDNAVLLKGGALILRSKPETGPASPFSLVVQQIQGQDGWRYLRAAFQKDGEIKMMWLIDSPWTKCQQMSPDSYRDLHYVGSRWRVVGKPYKASGFAKAAAKAGGFLGRLSDAAMRPFDTGIDYMDAGIADGLVYVASCLEAPGTCPILFPRNFKPTNVADAQILIDAEYTRASHGWKPGNDAQLLDTYNKTVGALPADLREKEEFYIDAHMPPGTAHTALERARFAAENFTFDGEARGETARAVEAGRSGNYAAAGVLGAVGVGEAGTKQAAVGALMGSAAGIFGRAAGALRVMDAASAAEAAGAAPLEAGRAASGYARTAKALQGVDTAANVAMTAGMAPQILKAPSDFNAALASCLHNSSRECAQHVNAAVGDVLLGVPLLHGFTAGGREGAPVESKTDTGGPEVDGRERAIKGLGQNLGRTTDDNAREFAALGYKEVDGPPGVIVYDNGHGSMVRLPFNDSGRPLEYSPEERAELEEALRRGGDYTHPGVGRAAIAGRARAVDRLAENIGRNNDYNKNEFAALGYERVPSHAGVVVYKDARGSTIKLPFNDSSFITKYSPAELAKVKEAVRGGGDYVHPEVRRADEAARAGAESTDWLTKNGYERSSRPEDQRPGLVVYRKADGSKITRSAPAETSRTAPVAATPSPADPVHIGVKMVENLGFKVSPEDARKLQNTETGSDELARAYHEGGYHDGTHSTGLRSVEGVMLGSLAGLEIPHGLRPETAGHVVVLGAIAASAHDAEATFVVVQKGGRSFLKYADPTKVNGVDSSKLGTPIESRTLPDGSKLLTYPKASGARSDLQSTLETLNNAKVLRDANDPLAKLMMLNGTAFSPKEKDLRDRLRPELERKIRAQYGPESDAVLKLAGEISDRMGTADVLNFYVRDTRSCFQGMLALEHEFHDPKVNVQGTYGFLKFVVGKDAKLMKGYSSLPLAERRNFVRNAVAAKIVNDNPRLVAHGVDDAVRAAARPQVTALLKAHPDWASRPFDQLLAAVDAIDTKALLADGEPAVARPRGAAEPAKAKPAPARGI